MKLKPTNKDTTIYARPDGWHYHLDRNCSMLQGGDFERLGYITITLKAIKRRHLNPCICCYEDFRPHKLIRQLTTLENIKEG